MEILRKEKKAKKIIVVVQMRLPFRILIWMCSRLSWEASRIDIKTAFLNATMSNEDEEALVFVKPPSFFIEKGFMERDVVFQPLKAVYGFRFVGRLDCGVFIVTKFCLTSGFQWKEERPCCFAILNQNLIYGR